jgi:hypothetical protein
MAPALFARGIHRRAQLVPPPRHASTPLLRMPVEWSDVAPSTTGPLHSLRVVLEPGSWRGRKGLRTSHQEEQ